MIILYIMAFVFFLVGFIAMADDQHGIGGFCWFIAVLWILLAVASDPNNWRPLGNEMWASNLHRCLRASQLGQRAFERIT